MEHAVDQQVRPVVIAPTYNNARTLGDVLSRIPARELPIIVVNDGSTDSTARLLEQWKQEHSESPLTILTNRRNRGKGAALRKGFAAGMKAGFTHAITIDTDGQHDPERISCLLERARREPDAYVLGVRDPRQEGYPRRSRLGRRVSNLLVRLECGLKVHDSQCGMRVYPLELVRAVRCRAGRYGYETEMITRAAWAGCPIVEAPINTRYLPLNQRISHFRPGVDTLRCGVMHVRLLLRAMAPLPHRRYQPHGVPLRGRVTFRDILKWMNPMRAWREMREGQIDRNELAAALAAGVFVANLPIYPLQTLGSLYLARRLHLNPLAVLVGSQLSTPPVGPLLIAGAICLGHLLLHGSWPPWPDFRSARFAWRTGRPLLADWAIGGVLCGLVLSILTFAITHALVRDEDEEAA